MERLPLTQPPPARYRKVLIDSRLRSSGDYSNFQVTIPSDVQLGDLCYVASCSFANTFQTISEDNNTFYFRFRTTTPGGFSVPPNRRCLAFMWRSVPNKQPCWARIPEDGRRLGRRD